MEYINIGSTPPEEDCFPLGHPGHRKECRIYQAQLEREFPDGNFGVKGFQHDFGTYYEVVAFLDEDADTPQTQAAYEAEGSGNPYWDEIAAKEVAELKGLYATGT